MEKIFFSSANLSFYPEALKESYESGTGWPDDVIEITEQQWRVFTGFQPAGKRLGADENGYPIWVSLPLPTRDELAAMAEAKKQQLINSANEYINKNQWPGKAAIGRLKGDDLTKYNLWLDYLDLLEVIDTSSYPDVEWPVSPLDVVA